MKNFKNRKSQSLYFWFLFIVLSRLCVKLVFKAF